MRLVYLVHDLDDAAVRRRLRFLREGGANVCLIGFRRHRGDTMQLSGEGISIGQTRNGRLLRRILSIARAVPLSRSWHGELRQADVILSRSLEMLLLAVIVRSWSGATTPIVYECLDIHRLMTRLDLTGKFLRWIERRLLDVSSLLVVSSPRFIDSYFSKFHDRLPPWRLLENKPLSSEIPVAHGVAGSPHPALQAPPWRIGWFGIIRCSRSLDLLAALVSTSGGRVDVDIRGRVAYDVIPEFDASVATVPGLVFSGAYDRTTDLAAIYGQVHFNWTIDFYEDGLNSAWLLPNRLYEGSLFGAIPLALRAVETGRWLAHNECGLLIDQPIEQTLPILFSTMTHAAYEAARHRVRTLDRAALLENAETATTFVSALGQLNRYTSTVPSIPGKARSR